jgi:hypothetical protein
MARLLWVFPVDLLQYLIIELQDWSVGRRPQRQTIIGLIHLQHLIEEIRDHALNTNGAQVFAILEILSMFEG